MEEDTLSLSELPLTKGDSSWKEYSAREDLRSSSFDDDDDGLFKFFSGDIAAAAASSYPAEKIIFCGKDIANNKEPKMDRDAHREEEFNTITKPPKSSLSFNKVGATSYTSSRHQQVRNQRILALRENNGYVTNRQAQKYDLSMQATPEKPRWYFFVLGTGRHSMETDIEMEQRAIKTRQSRKGSARMFQTLENGEVKMGKGRRPGKGSWGLLRLFGCTDKCADSVVKASLVCMPEV